MERGGKKIGGALFQIPVKISYVAKPTPLPKRKTFPSRLTAQWAWPVFPRFWIPQFGGSASAVQTGFVPRVRGRGVLEKGVEKP